MLVRDERRPLTNVNNSFSSPNFVKCADLDVIVIDACQGGDSEK